MKSYNTVMQYNIKMIIMLTVESNRIDTIVEVIILDRWVKLLLLLCDQIPGPGAHKVVDVSVYKLRPPKYSMTAKHPPLGDNTVKPGPGSHCPEMVSISPQFCTYLSPVSTARVDDPSTQLVETRARQHGPCWRVMETGHPSTRAINSGRQVG